MRKFTSHLGIAAPLIRNNIDTDAIIPSVEMKRVSKRGLAGGLFAGWRYTDRVQRVEHPEFVLNRAPYRNATILLAGKNFGCGSSREHAVWALDEFGIRVVVAESFGAIFRSNCIANGLLPVHLTADEIGKIANWVETNPAQNRVEVDLENRQLRAGADIHLAFDIEPSDAEMLLNGWDPIALTLKSQSVINKFQRNDRSRRPWVYL